MIINEVGDTDNETLNKTFLEAFDLFNVLEEKRNEARNWDFIQKTVSDIMIEKMRGRIDVKRKVRGCGHSEGERLLRNSMFFGCYPKHLIHDKDKLKFLNEKLSKKEITMSVYKELISCLENIKRKNIIKPKQLLEEMFDGI